MSLRKFTAHSLLAATLWSSSPGELNPCTGTIIAEDLVVLAAHCIKESSSFKVIFSLDATDSHAPTRSVIAYDVPMTFDYNYGSKSPYPIKQ